MTTSDNRRWAWFGPLAVVLWIGGIILLNHNGPADHATNSEIFAWYRSNSNHVIVGGWLFCLGCLSFVSFIAGLRTRFVDAAGRPSQLSGLVLVGAGMAGVCAMLVALVDLVAAVDKNDINATMAAQFHHSTDLFFIATELAAVLPLAAIAIAAWRTRALPRWWAGFAGLVAIVLAAGPIGWMGLIFGLPLFTLGTTVIVLLGPVSRPRAAAAAV
jgi:hypothetical protein